MRSVGALGGFLAGVALVGWFGWQSTSSVRAAAVTPDFRFVAMTDEWEDLCNELSDSFGFDINYDPAGQDFLEWYFDAIEELSEIIFNNGGLDPMLEAQEWGEKILNAYGVQPGDLDGP